jgi:lipopolysaccharide transport system permease protein
LLSLQHLRQLYGYRDLILRLAWSDFKLRYKNSVLGFFWSLLEPLLMLLILYIVFSNLMRIQVEHYQLFILMGIVLWNFLDRATSMSITGITGKPSLILKVYFPRDILVISSCLTAMFMTLLEMVVVAVFIVAFDVSIGWTILYAPLIFSLEFLVVLGISLILGCLNVYFRDVQFIWRLIVQVGFFATPVLYPITIFPASLQSIVMLNPMARVIIMLRDCVLYQTAPGMGSMAYLAASAIIMLICGYIIFDRLEPGLAEAI